MRKERIPLYEDIKPAYDNDTDNEFISAPFSSVQTEYPNPDEVIEKQDRTELIHKQMEKLSAPYRTILTLYHLDQMSYQEIGEIMNLPEGTVKSYLFRGRKKLKENLVRELEGEEI
jgi:RNA polymerase sigma-70 factor (ECF subfamily)